MRVQRIEKEVPTVFHRLSTDARLLLAILWGLMALLLPFSWWFSLAMVLLIGFGGVSLANVPLPVLTERLTWFWTPLILIGLGSGALAGNWGLAFEIWLRATLCFVMVIWLLAVLPMSELLATLRRWRLPLLLVGGLALIHRFVDIFGDERQRMWRAREARSFGRLGWWRSWQIELQMTRQLVRRAWSRAQRVRRAMVVRGWTARGQIGDSAT